MPVKVVHVVRQYLPNIGGMEDVVYNLVHHQRLGGQYLPTVVTLDRLFKDPDKKLPARELIDGVEVVRLPYFGSSRYPICLSVLKAIRGADIVHVHGIDFFFDFLALTRLFHRVPLVATTHGGFFHTSFFSKLKKIYFKTVTKMSALGYDKIVATSENDALTFGSIVDPSRLVTIENGVNVEKFKDHAAQHLTSTIIYFGRWSANKGILEALSLFKELWLKNPMWKLIIAGREYDLKLEDLDSKVSIMGLSDCVKLAPNPSDTELQGLIGEASYFISLSKYEGFGLAPVEAMSAGLTPILSDIPPFRKLVDLVKPSAILYTDEVGHTSDCVRGLHEEGDAAYAKRRSRLQSFAGGFDFYTTIRLYGAVYSKIL